MYRPISDYAIIGDCHTAALISSEGSIDWCCLPQFDSPALFLRLLDNQQGGYCTVHPAEPALPSRQYVPGTNILETSWETTGGALCVTDFMPVSRTPRLSFDREMGRDIVGHQCMLRLITCRRESVSVAVEVRPTFNYAASQTELQIAGDGVVIGQCDDSRVRVHLIGRSLLPGKGGRAVSVFRMQPGESIAVAITWYKAGEEPEPWTLDSVRDSLRETRTYWEEWSQAFDYHGAYPEAVRRSALALKLMTFEPTGAIVAAPTTSLPEQIGGVRNWDYRYSWIRDATFTLIALMNLGYFSEARDFLHFFRRTLGDHDTFQVLYGIRGERDASERVLSHLHGYMGSRPVRVGNQAVSQSQLDVFGELIHCIYLYIAHPETKVSGSEFHRDFWPIVVVAAQQVAEKWMHPDRGIWESRGKLQHFTYSKGMCWLALDRAIRLSHYCGESEHVGRWQQQRDALLHSFMTEGFNTSVGAFTQAYGSDAIDAAILRLPILGVIDANHPKMLATIDRIERTLMRNGLVYRYRVDDGLPGNEGAFLACSFWMVDNYVLCGRLREARSLFQHILTFANDVGLMSEEVDVETGTALGNFPQAFTHIALINSALRLAEARNGRRAGSHALPETLSLDLHAA